MNIETCRKIFVKYGGKEIDTPVMEHKDTLMEKYGEEGKKLIYSLSEEQTNEKLALRYDLTVPFSRYLGMNGIASMKRFQIGKVYRRDQPQVSKGRYREFYQCDFDFCGEQTLPMIQEGEILSLVYNVIKTLLDPLGLNFIIKINDRKLLNLCLALCGVNGPDMVKSVCQSIDKLDKVEFEDIIGELISKGLSEENITKIREFISYKGDIMGILGFVKDSLDNEESLSFAKELSTSPKFNEIYEEFSILTSYLTSRDVNISPSDDGGLVNGGGYEYNEIVSGIEFDFSLCRGLDYYTGLIYEVKVLDEGFKKKVSCFIINFIL